MVRVTKSADKDRLVGLKTLAALLNFDFEAGDPAGLASLKKLPPTERFIAEWSLKKFPKEARADQCEVKELLLSIVQPQGEVSPAEAEQRIKKLLAKINQFTSKVEWGVEPVAHRWEPVGDSEPPTDWKLVQKDSEDIGDSAESITASKKIELLGYSWFFGREFEESTFSLSEILYLGILGALENGTFDRLRTCPFCKKFFVGDDARQKFCNDEHRNQFNNQNRLESGYFSDLRRKKLHNGLKIARRLKRKGKSLAEIQRKTGLSLRVLKKGGIAH
jgi:hypothetical protein